MNIKLERKTLTDRGHTYIHYVHMGTVKAICHHGDYYPHGHNNIDWLVLVRYLYWTKSALCWPDFISLPLHVTLALHYKTRIGLFAQGQILCISLNGLQAGNCDAPPPPHFGWPKMNFDRISRNFRSIRKFYLFFLKMAAGGHFGWISIAFLAISDQYPTFFFTKWLPAATLDDRKSLLIIFLTISDQYATFIFLDFVHKMAAGCHFGWPKITYRISRHFRSMRNFYLFWFFLQNGCRRPSWMTENHFWSHFSLFQINMQLFFFTKWLPEAILDDLKSLLIAFLTISDQYTTFFF